MVVYIKYRHDIQSTIMIFYGGRVVQHWVALVSLRFEKRCKFLPLDNFLLFFFLTENDRCAFHGRRSYNSFDQPSICPACLSDFIHFNTNATTIKRLRKVVCLSRLKGR